MAVDFFNRMEANQMNDCSFKIGAPGIDVDSIVEKVRNTVAARQESGDYTDARVARAERSNLVNMQDEEQFLSFYLECLRDAVFVNINDFDIFERRARFASFFVALKRVIWKLLRFYTYRLWSQQNQTNGLLLSAVESTENKYREKIADLEARIEHLEAAGKG